MCILNQYYIVGLSCPRAGYMIPDENNLCFVWFCEAAGVAPMKRACPKGVRVPSWWEGGELNMCFIVNIVKHFGEPVCLRCDANDIPPTTGVSLVHYYNAGCRRCATVNKCHAAFVTKCIIRQYKKHLICFQKLDTNIREPGNTWVNAFSTLSISNNKLYALFRLIVLNKYLAIRYCIQ